MSDNASRRPPRRLRDDRSVRSVAVGFWVGAGARDERPAGGRLTHFIEHLLFKGGARTTRSRSPSCSTPRRRAQRVPTRESTLVHARVLDDHLPLALDVMCDMAARPASRSSDRAGARGRARGDRDGRGRASDRVHDLAARCVFGEDDARPSLIGSAATVLALGERGDRGRPRRALRRRATSSSRPPATSSTRPFASSSPSACCSAPADARRALAAAVAAGAASCSSADTEQYHVCLSGPGSPARRRSPLRALAARPRARRHGLVAALAGDPRAPRHGLLRLHLHVGYADCGQVGIYVGTRAENLEECLSIVRDETAELARRRSAADELERAKESVKGRMLLALESTSSRMSRLGSTCSAAARSSRSTRSPRASTRSRTSRSPRSPRELLAPERFSAAGIGPDEDLFARGRRRRGRAAPAGGVTRVVLAGASGRTGTPVADGVRGGRRPRARRPRRAEPRRRGPGLLRLASPRRSTSVAADVVRRLHAPRARRGARARRLAQRPRRGARHDRPRCRGARALRRGRARSRAAGLPRAELRDRRRARDALRRRGRAAPPARRDRRAALPAQARRARRARPRRRPSASARSPGATSRSTRCACPVCRPPGDAARRRGRAADDPPRRALARGVRARACCSRSGACAICRPA